MIRVLVVDDEALARRRLKRLLSEHEDVRVVAECANGRDAIEALRTHDVDLVFLDVQMPGVDGFDVVRTVGVERMPFVVFVTAYTDFALRAFDVHAIDYLVKPSSEERLRATLDRVRGFLGDRAGASSGRQLQEMLARALATAGAAVQTQAPSAPPPPDRIRIREGDRVLFVKVRDVDWFEADGNNVKVHLGRAVHQMRETMTAVEKSLDPARFARIHRSAIVNLERVRELEPWFAGDAILVLQSGERLKVSRTYREQLQETLYLL